VPVYGVSTYYSDNPSISGEDCSSLNPRAGSYYLSVMTSQERPIWKTILRPLAGASSSTVTLDRDSAKEYPEIEGSACWNPAIEARRINMVGPVRGYSHNSSSKYPTIGGFEEFDARTPAAILFII
jgi:hypothetical protein